MDTRISSQAIVFGANIDTDQIYPGRYLDLVLPQEIGLHAMEGVDAHFVERAKQMNIVVASTNFGCGSSREHAVIALKEAGIRAIIADSFGRIFYRNAINLGVAAIICKDISHAVQTGDRVSINVEDGTIVNERSGAILHAAPLGEYVMDILAHGGIKPMIRERLKAH